VLGLFAGVLLEKQIVVICPNLVWFYLSIVTMYFSFMLSFFPLIVALLKCLTAGCLVSNCLINYTNDKAIPVAKFVASCKFTISCKI